MNNPSSSLLPPRLPSPLSQNQAAQKRYQHLLDSLTNQSFSANTNTNADADADADADATTDAALPRRSQPEFRSGTPATESRHARLTQYLTIQRLQRRYTRLLTWQDYARTRDVDDLSFSAPYLSVPPAPAVTSDHDSGAREHAGEDRGRDEGARVELQKQKQMRLAELCAVSARCTRELELAVISARRELEREKMRFEVLRVQQEQQREKEADGVEEAVVSVESENGEETQARKHQAEVRPTEDDRAVQTRQIRGLIAARQVLQDWLTECLARCELLNPAERDGRSGVEIVDEADEKSSVPVSDREGDADDQQKRHESKGQVEKERQEKEEGKTIVDQSSQAKNQVARRIDDEYERYIAARRRLVQLTAVLGEAVPLSSSPAALPAHPHSKSISLATPSLPPLGPSSSNLEPSRGSSSSVQPLHSHSQSRPPTSTSTPTLENPQTSTTPLSLLIAPNQYFNHHHHALLATHQTHLNHTTQTHRTTLLTTLDRLACESHLLPLHPASETNTRTATATLAAHEPSNTLQTTITARFDPQTTKRAYYLHTTNPDSADEGMQIRRLLRSWRHAAQSAEGELERYVAGHALVGGEGLQEAEKEVEGLSDWKARRRVIERL